MAMMEAAPRWTPIDRLLQAFSGLARGPGWLILTSGLAARRAPRARRAMASAALAFGSSLLLELGLKLLVHRKRPDRDHGEHQPGPKDMERHSFPSGHAVGAFACAASTACVYPQSTPYALAGATLLSSARVYLRRHNPSDVIAGALMGIALGIGAERLAKLWRT